MRLKYLLIGGLMLIATVFVPRARAQTLWTNTSITFEQTTNAGVLTSDFLTAEASITRNNNGTLFNNSSSPTPDTVLWAIGTIQNFGSLDYQPMENYRDGFTQPLILGNPWVIWLKNENIYIPVTFSAWGSMHHGSWTYTRGTAPAVPPPTPVTLISPMISGGSFIFSFTNATAGLTYVLKTSSNLTSWTPVATNVASGSTGSFTNTLTTGAHFFRVQTLPAGS